MIENDCSEDSHVGNTIFNVIAKIVKLISGTFKEKEIIILTANWHQTNYRVPYKDTDRMGVVHHGNYINWFEIARTECMRHYGIAYSDVEKRGFLLPVLKVECDYKKSATFDEPVAIYTKIAEYSPIKLTFAYEARKISEADFATTHNQIVDEPVGELITSGATKHMWVNQDFKSTRLQRSAPDLYQVIEKVGERK